MRHLLFLLLLCVGVQASPQTKNILLEWYTTTPTPYSPDGVVYLDKVKAQYNIIDVAIHTGYLSANDAMNNRDGDSLAAKFQSTGSPLGSVDRADHGNGVVMSRQYWEDYAANQEQTTTKVEVEIKNDYTASTRKLDYTISTHFLESVGPEVRLFVYLVEDSIPGTGMGYEQRNYYNNQSNHPFFGQGDPVKDFYHRNVLRSNLTGLKGRSLGANHSKNDDETVTGSVVIPSGYNKKQVYLVAFVGYFATTTAGNQVLNATKEGLFPDCQADFSYSFGSGYKVNFTNTSQGFETVEWSFGDGTITTQENPQHTYAKGGTYTVTLKTMVKGSECHSVSKQVVVPYACAADFDYSVSALKAVFTNKSLGDGKKMNWDFGDGNSSSATSPTYTFSTKGTYRVLLTVYDPDDLFCDSVSKVVVVDDAVSCEPSYSYSANQLKVSFTNTSNGNYKSLKWDFGDGNQSSNGDPTYTYNAAGTYSACLSLYDDNNQLCGEKYCQDVTVSEGTSVDKVNASPKLQVFPNPAGSRLTLRSESTFDQVQLFDATGMLVYSNTGKQEVLSMDVSGLPVGNYVLKVFSEHGVYPVQRIVVSR